MTAPRRSGRPQRKGRPAGPRGAGPPRGRQGPSRPPELDPARMAALELLTAVRVRNAYANLASSPFEQIVVTDTIPLRAGAPDKILVLSCADMLTDSIRRIFTDDSVSEIFAGENQLF